MNLCFEQSFLTAAISSVVAGGYGMAAGDSATKAVGQVLFGTFAGGITAELSGGNFWQGAVTGLVVSLLNHTFHSIEINQQDPNKELAKQIAKDYGYDDWREIKAFLDEHPFVPTEKGIKFLDSEAVSSKFEGSGITKLVNKYGDDAINKGLGMILKKIIGKSAGQALSSTSLQEQEPLGNALKRAENCKTRLIEHVLENLWNIKLHQCSIICKVGNLIQVFMINYSIDIISYYAKKTYTIHDYLFNNIIH